MDFGWIVIIVCAVLATLCFTLVGMMSNADIKNYFNFKEEGSDQYFRFQQAYDINPKNFTGVQIVCDYTDKLLMTSEVVLASHFLARQYHYDSNLFVLTDKRLIYTAISFGKSNTKTIFYDKLQTVEVSGSALTKDLKIKSKDTEIEILFFSTQNVVLDEFYSILMDKQAQYA